MKKINEQERKIPTDRRNNLARMEIVEKHLLEVKRIAQNDREILAANLGEMFYGVQKKRSLNLRKIFYEAFGDKIADGHYKKRKRLITLPGEKPAKEGAEGLRSRAEPFLELVKVLEKYIEYPEKSAPEQRRAYAILRFIKGSSYDVEQAHDQRMEIEYKSEIDAVLKNLVTKITSVVDLEWMDSWSDKHCTAVSGMVGCMEKIVDSERTYLRSSMRLNSYVRSRLAPCVRIASVLSEYKVKCLLTIEIDKEVDEVTQSDLKKKIAKIAGYKNFDTFEWALEDHKKNEEIYDELIGAGAGLESDLNLYYKSAIDLELRFDEDYFEWKPVFLWRRLLIDENLTAEENGISTCIFQDSMGTLPAIQVAFDFHAYEEIYAIAVPDQAEKGKAIFKIFVGDGYGKDLYPCMGHCCESAIYQGDPQSEYYEFLLRDGLSDADYEAGHVNLTFHIDGSESTRYVPAPDNSIACTILKNMAYSPNEKRIDNVLLHDAQHKYRSLKKYAQKCQEEFHEAIKRNDS